MSGVSGQIHEKQGGGSGWPLAGRTRRARAPHRKRGRIRVQKATGLPRSATVSGSWHETRPAVRLGGFANLGAMHEYGAAQHNLAPPPYPATGDGQARTARAGALAGDCPNRKTSTRWAAPTRRHTTIGRFDRGGLAPRFKGGMLRVSLACRALQAARFKGMTLIRSPGCRCAPGRAAHCWGVQVTIL